VDTDQRLTDSLGELARGVADQEPTVCSTEPADLPGARQRAHLHPDPEAVEDSERSGPQCQRGSDFVQLRRLLVDDAGDVSVHEAQRGCEATDPPTDDDYGAVHTQSLPHPEDHDDRATLSRRREVRTLPLARGAEDNGRVEEVVTLLITDGRPAGSQTGFLQGNVRQTCPHQTGAPPTQRKEERKRARHLGTDPR
jgi:hypothetical protein